VARRRPRRQGEQAHDQYPDRDRAVVETASSGRRFQQLLPKGRSKPFDPTRHARRPAPAGADRRPGRRPPPAPSRAPHRPSPRSSRMNRYPAEVHPDRGRIVIVSSHAAQLLPRVPACSVDVEATVRSTRERSRRSRATAEGGRRRPRAPRSTGRLKVRLADTDTQLKAEGRAAEGLGTNYIVALNSSRRRRSGSPRSARCDVPGLDLRGGGCNFLLQIDMKVRDRQAPTANHRHSVR